MPLITQLNRFLFENSVINFSNIFHKLKLRFLFLTFYEGKVSMSILHNIIVDGYTTFKSFLSFYLLGINEPFRLN